MPTSRKWMPCSDAFLTGPPKYNWRRIPSGDNCRSPQRFEGDGFISDTYEEWYNEPHRAPDLQTEAVYGLTGTYREEVRAARSAANPGCYPTSIQLPLIPLPKSGIIENENIIINANPGVSGAGRGAKEANLSTETCEGIHPYGITRHRHVPEIEQGLGDAVG